MPEPREKSPIRRRRKRKSNKGALVKGVSRKLPVDILWEPSFKIGLKEISRGYSGIKKTTLNKLSLGQKATVLIKIYLAQGANPIIIDSHDDHLDNEFIMDELVGAIRQAKTYRQVILASNNGNVVINSDAEQVVIARRENGAISCESGAIENPSIRDKALQVLEGGAAAFKKRQEKYRINS